MFTLTVFFVVVIELIYNDSHFARIRVSCHTDPITLDISERSYTHGQAWQQVTIPNPQPCRTNRLYFPILEVSK